MALRLGEYVVYGEIRNTQPYSTHGAIVLRGENAGDETQIRFELTGDCDDDLRGKCCRFWPEDEAGQEVFNPEDYEKVQRSQIGPTGTMTAAGWVRALPCSVEEYLHRAELGEPPPTPWKRRLYLEWYGQNGPVVIEVPGVIVEEQVRKPEDPDDDGEWRPLPNPAPHPDSVDPPATPGLGITIIENNDADPDSDDWTTTDYTVHHEDTEDPPPDALQRHLDAEAAAIDRTIRDENDLDDDDDYSETIRETELMDHCIDHGEGKTIESIVGGAGGLKPADQLDDGEVEDTLKTLLAQMALCGIALHVCPHFSPRDCYELLRTEILPEQTAYEELIGTGWVQNFMTDEFCPECEAEHDIEPWDEPQAPE